MQKPAPSTSYWITNLSKTDVSLGDLCITVKALTSINLLDAKHYPYLTFDLIKKSETSGSLFKKRNKIVHRKFPPQTIEGNNISLDTVSYIPTRQHSIIEIKQEKYSELDIVDDDIISNLSNTNNDEE